MCCIVEIAMSVWGIVTLTRGQFALSKSKVVRGGPAYLIGGILLLTLPIPLCIGIVVGAMHMATTGQQPTVEDLSQYAYIDFVSVGVVVALVFTIAMATAQDESKQQSPLGYSSTPEPNFPQDLPPSDPNNPYDSPRT